MESQVRFCTTSDGVRIAYQADGRGPVLVRSLAWFTHLEFDWELGRAEALAAHHTYVRYDGRGMGLSDREVDDFSLDAQVRDLEAVVNAVAPGGCSIVAWSQGGPTAITFAVRHPERVRRLVLYGSFARPPVRPDQADLGVALIRQGWGSEAPAHRQFFTGIFMPDADLHWIRWFNELQRISASAGNAAAAASAFMRYDVRDLLPHVRVPTLVIHRRGDTAIPFERGRELAAGIPGATFLALEGRNHALLPDEPEAERYLAAVLGFLAEDRAAQAGPTAAGPLAGARAPLTILFTDIEASTALTQRLGDAGAQELVRTHDTIVREALREAGGDAVKHTGDGIMAAFPSAAAAVRCALAIQDAIARRCGDSDLPLRVRIGLNAGEPVAESDDLFGTAVQLARRICDQAEPGQVLVSDVVRQLAAGKGFQFTDRGLATLKGFGEPARVYEPVTR